MKKGPVFMIVLATILIGLFTLYACSWPRSGNNQTDISDTNASTEFFDEAYNKAVLLTQKAESDPDFAASYGGCYLDNDETLLIVLLKGKEAKKICKELIGKKRVKYVQCDYSLQELKEIQKTVADSIRLLSDKAVRESVASIGIREYLNRVNIGMMDNSEAAIERLKKAVPEAGDPRIVFNAPIPSEWISSN